MRRRSIQPGRLGLVLFATGAALLPATAPPDAAAHVSKTSGSFRVEFGWAQEPPQPGVENAVEAEVLEASGAPVEVPAGALSAEVSYGDAAVTLPLVPSDRSGVLEAELVPTRPGAYGLHITGAVRGRTLDVSAACSDSTFQCVEAGSVAEFPVDDPSPGELSQRLSRESERAQEANDAADTARILGIVALAVAALAVAVALRVARRSVRP